MNTDSTYPEFFARFYDVLYQDIREGDQNYYLNKIRYTQGPVLEIGTGTGRFFSETLKTGADIYGVDISPEMLNVLLKKIPLKDRFRVSVDDIRTMKLNKRFELIVAPFRVFQHLMTPDDQIKALNNVYDHLNPGGHFIFDLFVPNVKLLNEGLQNTRDFDGEYAPGRKLQRYTSMKADVVNQISHVTFKLVWDEEGRENAKEWKTSIRFLFRFELELLIKASRFENFKMFGDFDENELTTNSSEFVIECQKSPA